MGPVFLLNPYSKKAVHLPINNVSNSSNVTAWISPTAIPAKAQILIVDDSVLNQSIALKLLESLGYAADVASDGQRAIDACGPISKWDDGVPPYQLIFMDCDMPRVDGYQATQSIRDLEQKAQARYPSERTSRIAIVALTTNAMTTDRVRAFASGMDDFLTKPVTSEILFHAIERWLPGRCHHARHYHGEAYLPAAPSSSQCLDTAYPNDIYSTVQNPTNVNTMSVLLPQPSQTSPSLTSSLDRELHLNHLDWSHLHTLSDNDTTFEMTLLELFVEDCQAKLQELKDAIAQTDITRIERLSHYIKGASANIGAEYMQHYAHQIEQQVRQTQLTCFDLEMNRLETSFNIVQDLWAAQQ